MSEEKTATRIDGPDCTYCKGKGWLNAMDADQVEVESSDRVTLLAVTRAATELPGPNGYCYDHHGEKYFTVSEEVMAVVHAALAALSDEVKREMEKS